MEDFSGVEHVKSTYENTQILLELLKYYGRDCNLVEVFDLFKNVSKKISEGQMLSSDEMLRRDFLKAL